MTASPSNIADRLIDEAARLTEVSEVQDEKRSQTRHPLDAPAVLVLLSYEGQLSTPMLVRTVDISHGGMRIVSRNMIHPGAKGAAQMMRSTGKAAVVGVQVMHCRYVGSMQHHTGLKFVPLPGSFPIERFLDSHGRPMIEQAADSMREKRTGL